MVSFNSFVWLLEDLKLHIWLISYSYWTVLFWTTKFLMHRNVIWLQKENFIYRQATSPQTSVSWVKGGRGGHAERDYLFRWIGQMYKLDLPRAQCWNTRLWEGCDTVRNAHPLSLCQGCCCSHPGGWISCNKRKTRKVWVPRGFCTCTRQCSLPLPCTTMTHIPTKDTETHLQANTASLKYPVTHIHLQTQI